jgi:hypothetical protein
LILKVRGNLRHQFFQVLLSNIQVLRKHDSIFLIVSMKVPSNLEPFFLFYPRKYPLANSDALSWLYLSLVLDNSLKSLQWVLSKEDAWDFLFPQIHLLLRIHQSLYRLIAWLFFYQRDLCMGLEFNQNNWTMVEYLHNLLLSHSSYQRLKPSLSTLR